MAQPDLKQSGLTRCQPDATRAFFGHDNLARWKIEVEWAVLETFADIGVMYRDEAALLKPDLKAHLIANITTTMVDEREQEVGNEVRALTELIREHLPEPLRRFVHLTLTSEDTNHSAQALMFRRAHAALRPLIARVVKELGELCDEHKGSVQAGRTHLQQATPITFGRTLAPTVERIIQCASRMDERIERVRGKISGALGTYSAQRALGIQTRTRGGPSFEARVLARLGLRPDVIATQLTLPESIADYLHSAVLMTGALGQFGNDMRHLMSTEIAEVFVAQGGSSTMPHKVNPTKFERLEGLHKLAKDEYSKVLDTLISTESRDLVGSLLTRSFPVIVVYLAEQLETLLAEREGKSLIRRMQFDGGRARENMRAQERSMLTEALYCALQRYGYPGDAHALVSRKIGPLVRSGLSPWAASIHIALRDAEAKKDRELLPALFRIPQDLRDMLEAPLPHAYIGDAKEQASVVAARAAAFAAAYAKDPAR